MSEIILDEITHEYNIDGIKFPSVSKILQATGIAPDLSFLDPIYAQRGTENHKIAEAYFAGLADGDDPVIKHIKNFFVFLGEPSKAESEYRLCNAKLGYCGTADLILHYEQGVVICDFKSGKANKESVKWQLSMYAEAYEQMTGEKVVDLYVLEHFADDDFRYFGTDRVSAENIATLMQYYAEGKRYLDGTELITGGDCEVLTASLNAIAKWQGFIKESEARIETIKAKIMEQMQKANLKKFESDALSFTIKAGSTQERVDSKKLKQFPDVYKECTKTINVKESLIIKVKENKDDNI